MIYISLGSNLGNRLQNLQNAIELLKHQTSLQNIKCSIVFETAALLPLEHDQSWNLPYLNMVISCNTDLNPLELLAELKLIEQKLGRSSPYSKWAPRIIDLDIIWWDGVCFANNKLTIPHPELQNRKFLLDLLQTLGLNIINNKDHIKNMNTTDSDFPKTFLDTFVANPKIMGILNITDDSFSDGGLYSTVDAAIKRATEIIADGASIIDIGAQSTRPGAKMISADEEYNKLNIVLAELEKLTQDRNIKISIDTFHDEVVLKLIDKYSIALMNNVKGWYSDNAMRALAINGCGIVMMHSLSIPPKPDLVIPNNLIPIDIILAWGKKAMTHALDLGFKNENIVLDPGIGFGKTANQNIEIIHEIGKMQKLGAKVLLGHSRKSFINKFSNAPINERDVETIAISCLVKDKVDFLRVHDVNGHMRALVAQQVISRS